MDIDGVAPTDNQASNTNQRSTDAFDLYYFPASPSCWAVMLVGRAVGINFNLKAVNIMARENMKPSFLKINPEHTVPVLDDHGFKLWESRPILQYIIDQYGRNSSLNPRSPRRWAIVNQRLFFDAATLFPRLRSYFLPVLKHGFSPDQEKAEKFLEAMQYLDVFLKGQSWTGGPSMTIADFSIVTTVATAEAVLFDISKYPNVWSWYQKVQKAMEQYGYKEIVESGANMIGSMFKRKIKIWSK